ncbi:hypothetical protein V12B01_13325 [Vibrio splendidus 12B01]|nr:hypothetical protein V12B01_13325 [Vibrio splendidus 12B01]
MSYDDYRTTAFSVGPKLISVVECFNQREERNARSQYFVSVSACDESYVKSFARVV